MANAAPQWTDEERARLFTQVVAAYGSAFSDVISPLQNEDDPEKKFEEPVISTPDGAMEATEVLTRLSDFDVALPPQLAREVARLLSLADVDSSTTYADAATMLIEAIDEMTS